MVSSGTVYITKQLRMLNLSWDLKAWCNAYFKVKTEPLRERREVKDHLVHTFLRLTEVVIILDSSFPERQRTRLALALSVFSIIGVAKHLSSL